MIERRVGEWEEADFESVGYHFITDGPDRVEVFFVLEGGRDEEEVFVSREEIDRLVEEIRGEVEVQRTENLTETQQAI